MPGTYHNSILFATVFLRISTTHSPATDLGYLLHKHPAKVQNFKLNFGSATVFYTEATDDRCSAVLLLDVDPVGIVRRNRNVHSTFTLFPYVNDRPYVASSFLSVAIADVYTTALNGKCKDRPDVVDQAIPLEVHLPTVPCRGGEDLLRRLFEPLGYSVTVEHIPLEPAFPEWGESRYFSLHLAATMRLSDLLSHLYVLFPVLDNDKHYWIGSDEVEKLLRRGEGWLAGHPERELIAKRYLKGRSSLATEALAQLVAADGDDPDQEEAAHDREESASEVKIGLHTIRLDQVLAELTSSGARRVLDLGCGEGRLLKMLLREPLFTEIVGMDVSHRDLALAARRLNFRELTEAQRDRIKLVHGSLVYRDKRLQGYDAAAVVEVIEHLDPFRLQAFERILFGFARPRTIVMTTPNSEYNVIWPSLPAGSVRHRDHRFEWTRQEFEAWGNRVAAEHGYSVVYKGIGEEAESVGTPSQMGVFSR